MTTSNARRLVGRLREAGLTQQDLADQLGMEAISLSRILNGRRRLPEGFELAEGRA